MERERWRRAEMNWMVNMSDVGITLILTSFFCSVNCFVYIFKIRAPFTQVKPTKLGIP